jgi:hypothetical protein
LAANSCGGRGGIGWWLDRAGAPKQRERQNEGLRGAGTDTFLHGHRAQAGCFSAQLLNGSKLADLVGHGCCGAIAGTFPRETRFCSRTNSDKGGIVDSPSWLLKSVRGE